jgi:TRAP-type mannitol/chloroaromatic compound transport system permease small subunit
MIIVAFVLLLQALAQVIKYLSIVLGTVDEAEAAKIEEYHEVAVE